MPHQLVLKYLSSNTNFVFNQTLFTREICRNDTFKLLLKTILKGLFPNKGEILSSKSVKPCKNRKKKLTGVSDARTRDKSGSNSPSLQGNVQIPPSPGTMHSQIPGVCLGRKLKLQFDRYITVAYNTNEKLGLASETERFFGVRVFCFRCSFSSDI